MLMEEFWLQSVSLQTKIKGLFMKKDRIIGLAFLLVIMQSYCQKNKITTVTITNKLAIERSFETVSLTSEALKCENLTLIGIKDKSTGQLQVTQTIDNDGDGVMDVILFQPKVAAKSKSFYEIVLVSEDTKPKAPEYCYSRFVPERTDDYTWENNRVAFRVYGPKAQKMKEQGDPAGTLSSGVDAWFKKVEYPIINKWHKKNSEGTGSYHKDTGEGKDCFHVGSSRGVGGIAIKRDTIYYTSKNYVEYKTITTGPIRTSFYLKFADWDAQGNTITESRIVSLDLGSNLSKFEVAIGGTDAIAAGLTLQEKSGVVNGNSKNNWLTHWETIESSEVGTAIVASKKYFKGYQIYKTKQVDLSNAYANLKVINNKVVYYAGFCWNESGQFANQQEWEDYLTLFSKKIQKPLIVKLGK